MIKYENIYVAVDKKGEIQWVKGSSSKTRYFRTDKYLKSAVEYHNKYYPDDVWEVKKCVIIDMATFLTIKEELRGDSNE